MSNNYENKNSYQDCCFVSKNGDIKNTMAFRLWTCAQVLSFLSNSARADTPNKGDHSNRSVDRLGAIDSSRVTARPTGCHTSSVWLSAPPRRLRGTVSARTWLLERIHLEAGLRSPTPGAKRPAQPQGPCKAGRLLITELEDMPRRAPSSRCLRFRADSLKRTSLGASSTALRRAAGHLSSSQCWYVDTSIRCWFVFFSWHL